MHCTGFAISAAFLAWGSSLSTFVARIIFAELVGAGAVALKVFHVYSGFDFDCSRRNNTDINGDLAMGGAACMPSSYRLVTFLRSGNVQEKYLGTIACNIYIYNCAHCTSNKNQHALKLFNGNRFRRTASSVQVN